MIIWDAPGFGLGDLLVAVHYCVRKSLLSGSPAYISRWAGFDRNVDQAKRLTDIIATIALPAGASVLISDELANTRMHGAPWSNRYFPTKNKWVGDRDYICCQFDGKSSAGLKNVPAGDRTMFDDWLNLAQVTSHHLGIEYDIDKCVKSLSRARFFVGVCSGMSHLALSVGCPTLVVEYELKIDWWYGPNPVVKCVGMNELIKKMDELWRK